MRFLVLDGRKLVAGCQLLIRKLPIGYVGYVMKGPIFSLQDEMLVYFVLNVMLKLCRSKHIWYLALQPPDNGQATEQFLTRMGFMCDSGLKADTATTIIDLKPPLDDILAKMTKNNRRFIRHGERKGVAVRDGSKEDIVIFFRMMLETCRRRGERPNPPEENHFHDIWRFFAPKSQVKLFLAEYQGLSVAGLFCIPFGNAMRAWKLGWFGDYGDLKPNQVMFWEAIKWAKSAGYEYFDFVGIDRNAAEAVLAGRHWSEVAKNDTFFKLMFGGEVRLLPNVYVYVYNPLLRFSYETLYPRMANNLKFSKFLKKRLAKYAGQETAVH